MQTKKVVKIGLFGESPHDTNAVLELLSKQYSTSLEFITMLPRLRGSMLDNKMTQIDLSIEFRTKKPDLVIVVRDLDDLVSNQAKVDKLNAFFNSSNQSVSSTGIFLLNVFELEALILCDIEALNAFYKIEASFSGDPMLTWEPKEILKGFTKPNKRSKRYTPGHCPKLFKLLDFNKLSSCSYFASFILDFDTRVQALG
jgi:hypothetical protein